MREIAAQARVSKSLLHYHFASKEDLLLAVLDEFFGGMIRRIEATTDALARKKSPDTLQDSIKAIWKELRARSDMQPVVLRIAALGTLDDAVRQRLLRFRSRIHAITVEGLRRSLGRDLPGLDAAAELLLACLVGFEASRLFAEDPRVVDRAFDLLQAMLPMAVAVLC
jgi:AcrR family transcriptional regulator